MKNFELTNSINPALLAKFQPSLPCSWSAPDTLLTTTPQQLLTHSFQSKTTQSFAQDEGKFSSAVHRRCTSFRICWTWARENRRIRAKCGEDSLAEHEAVPRRARQENERKVCGGSDGVAGEGEGVERGGLGLRAVRLTTSRTPSRPSYGTLCSLCSA